MAAPSSPHGRTFGHRRSMSQGGIVPPSTDGLVLRDTRLRLWHPVVAKMSGNTLQLIKTDQNVAEQHPLTEAKIDIITESGRDDAERRRLHSELGAACFAWPAGRSPGFAPFRVVAAGLPPPPAMPGAAPPTVAASRPSVAPTPFAIPRPPGHAPPPPPLMLDPKQLPSSPPHESRISNAGLRAIPPPIKPSSPRAEISSAQQLPPPPNRPSGQGATPQAQRPVSPMQRPVSPRTNSVYPVTPPPPLPGATGPQRSTSYYGDTNTRASQTGSSPTRARRDLPPPPPSAAVTLRGYAEFPPAPPSMAAAHRDHAPSLPVVPISRGDLPPAVPYMSIPRPHSPTPSHTGATMPPPPSLVTNQKRSVSPLPALHSIPAPLVLPPASPTTASTFIPARVSISPRTGAAASASSEAMEEEEWNKKFSEEERQAELRSSMTEQKVIESLRGTLHRLTRARSELVAPQLPVVLIAGSEEEKDAGPKVDKKPMIKETFGFRLELGRASALDDVSLNLYDYTDHYKTKFSGKPQVTFIGYLGNGTSEPTIISVLQEPQTTKFPEPTYYGLVRTKSSGQDEFYILETDLQAFVTSNKLQKKKLHFQAMFFRGAKLFWVEDIRIQPSLLKFEEQDPEVRPHPFVRSPAFAFAVTYSGPNDKVAIEMFNHKDGSAEFEDFIRLLGDRVELKGWQRFRGGLDVIHNTKGTHSVFTTFNKFEIMFHVSTLLPFVPADPLKLARARQVQNDVVMVIFRDGDANTLDPYDPLVQPTNVTHVFIIVSPLRINGALHYKVAVASKTNVTAFRPDLPLPAVFKADASFRTFLLTKLVNAQIATRKSGLHLMFTRPRAAMLNELVQRFLTAREKLELEKEEAAIPT